MYEHLYISLISILKNTTGKKNGVFIVFLLSTFRAPGITAVGSTDNSVLYVSSEIAEEIVPPVSTYFMRKILIIN